VRFCVVIPDRGDRPEFTKNCLRMLDRMTLKPDEIYHINYPVFEKGYDLIQRVRSGVLSAQKDGFDLCFIIENDDYYPANYFERFKPFFEDFHFAGQDFSDYYNIKNLTHNRFQHDYRASLFTTAFKISALNNFDWPPPEKPFLDIELWKYARHKKRKFIDTGAIGIKHGIGLCGGKGHKMYWPKTFDKNMNELRKRVDPVSFEFYKSMSDKLQLQPA
jgi:hypothetical protein